MVCLEIMATTRTKPPEINLVVNPFNRERFLTITNAKPFGQDGKLADWVERHFRLLERVSLDSTSMPYLVSIPLYAKLLLPDERRAGLYFFDIEDKKCEIVAEPPFWVVPQNATAVFSLIFITT